MSFTPNHPERARPHEAQHVRHLDLQVLDALLRIEELLTRLVDKMERAFDTDLQEAAEGNITDVIKDVAPIETPFAKSVTAPSKRKNPRQL